ncbi:MAG: type II secretion system protein [Candidatus Pacebacteria bacterium]|nr:type II secretion system protein [Candidatus Paceibacterota bacterium]
MAYKKAFTLVELLAVIAVIGILSSFIYVQTNNAINSGKDSKRKSDVALLASGVHVYNIGSDLPVSSSCNIGSTCSSEINEALTDQLGPLPADPDSGKAYIYQSDGTDCTISSVLSNGETYQYDCSDDAMSQSEPIDGQCGGAASTYMPGTTSWTSSEFCLGATPSSTPVFPSSDGTSVSWTCPGQYLGSPTTCTAYRALNGVCGTRANTALTAYAESVSSWPTSDYCSSGTSSSSPDFPGVGSFVSWVCTGIYGVDSSCFAYHALNGACGTAAITYPYSSTAWSGNFCSSGTANPVPTPSNFPAVGGSFQWQCVGVYGSDATCTASRQTVSAACVAAGGGWGWSRNYYNKESGSCVTSGTIYVGGPWRCYPPYINFDWFDAGAGWSLTSIYDPTCGYLNTYTK